MKPEREIELNQKLLNLLSEFASLENMDKDFSNDAEYHILGLRKILFNKIVKYEYHLYYLETKNRNKLMRKDFGIKKNAFPVLTFQDSK